MHKRSFSHQQTAVSNQQSANAAIGRGVLPYARNANTYRNAQSAADR
jgi:hypothetical protein